MIVFAARIEMHIAVADGPSGAAARALHDAAPVPIVAVESARFHVAADRRIERAAGLFRHGERELHGGEEQLAGAIGDAGPCRVSCRSSLSRIESIAQAFDLAEPLERALDRVIAARRRR